MGMSMHVAGLRPVDDKWRAMKAIWDACRTASVATPDEVIDFFDGVYPEDENVIEVELDKNAFTKYNGEYRSGFDVDLRRLPEHVTMVRFYCAY